MKKIFSGILLALVAVSPVFTACSKEYLDTTPTSAVAEANIFSSTENAMMAINGIHRYMHEGGSSGTTTSHYGKGGYPTFCLILAYMSDDLVWTFNNVMLQEMASWLNHRNLTHNYDTVNYYWKFYYTIINNANKVLQYIDDIPESGTVDYRNFVKGQALAYRAFAHFQLVQAWAVRYDAAGNNTQMGVIIRTEPSFENLPRSSVEEVYAQINKDLDDAIVCLEKTNAVKKNKSHIDQWVAKGLKARVLLTQGRWAEAAEVAKDVVDHSGAKLQDDTYTCGMKGSQMSDSNNTEWIWGQIHSDDASQHGTLRAWHTFISNNAASYNRNTPRAILNTLYATIPATDVRKKCWVENPYVLRKSTCLAPVEGGVVVPTGTARLAPWMSQKWQIDDGGVQNTYFDVPYMRLPEIMLIEAEGYARSNKPDEAKAVLNKLGKHRDPAYNCTATGNDLVEAIIWQRRVELWGESGLRWLDLKRLNLPCDRGKAPRAGYNQGGTTNGWGNTAKAMPTNLDPEASNYNMYGEQGQREDARYIPAGDKRWQWLIPTQELNINTLCKQNEL